MKTIYFQSVLLSMITLCFISCGKTPKNPKIKENEMDVKIEKAIANREFDKAREYAQTFSDYQNMADEFSARQERMNKINKAQISVMIDGGDIEGTESLAKELDALPVFWNLIENNVNKLYPAQFNSLYTILSRYPFTASYHKQFHGTPRTLDYAEEYAQTKEPYLKDSYYKTNVGYNDEVHKFNNIVTSILNRAIFEGNTTHIRHLLLLLKPEAVEISRTDAGYGEYGKEINIQYSLENNAKADALQKIKDAGINL